MIKASEKTNVSSSSSSSISSLPVVKKSLKRKKSLSQSSSNFTPIKTNNNKNITKITVKTSNEVKNNKYSNSLLNKKRLRSISSNTSSDSVVLKNNYQFSSNLIKKSDDQIAYQSINNSTKILSNSSIINNQINEADSNIKIIKDERDTSLNAFDKEFDLKFFTKADSKYLEDIEYIKKNFPNLLKIKCKIIFKVFELSCGSPKVSDNLFGVIQFFNLNTKNLLIKTIFPKEKIVQHKKLLDYLSDYYDSDVIAENQTLSILINVALKELIELKVEKNNIINEFNQEEKNNLELNEINPLSKIETQNTKNDCCDFVNNENLDDSKLKTFHRQMLFYFSTPYYEKNTFFLSNLDSDGCKFSIKII